MSADDYEVVVYKVLTYLYACLKAGVEPSTPKAKEVAGVNDVYWDSVMQWMFAKGLVTAVVANGWHGRAYSGVQITGDGAMYVKDNSKMAEVKAFLGKAFETVIEGAIAATFASGAGGIA